MYLFGRNIPNETGDYFFRGDIWVCRIWDNGALVRDYIPAIDENGVGFMFDRVTHKVYLNAGTGIFTFGDRLNVGRPKTKILKTIDSPYKREVEY